VAGKKNNSWSDETYAAEIEGKSGTDSNYLHKRFAEVVRRCLALRSSVVQNEQDLLGLFSGASECAEEGELKAFVRRVRSLLLS